MVKVYTIDNAVADGIEKWVTSSKVPWFYFDHTLGNPPIGAFEVEQDKYTIVDMPRFTHYFFPNSKTPGNDSACMQPLVNWLTKELLPGYHVKRAMGNLTTRIVDSDMLLNIPHKDSPTPGNYSFLYYVNTSDGCTVFFKDKKIDCEVEPIKGTGVLFPSDTVHAGQLPHKHKTRYVINIGLTKRV